jgi:hypothetical protein
MTRLFVHRMAGWAGLVKAFTEAEGAAPSSVSSSYLYRGQADAGWSLKPSLTRVLEDAGITSEARADAIERTLLHVFQARAHQHLPQSMLPPETDRPPWWVVMQHYGVPTRVLDWTESPHAALYFAVVSHPDRDPARTGRFAVR